MHSRASLFLNDHWEMADIDRSMVSVCKIRLKSMPFLTVQEGFPIAQQLLFQGVFA